MMFLLNTISMRDSDEIAQAFKRYDAYLNRIRDKLPKDAYAFASASWHYDLEDHRCPHDSWLEQFILNEPSTGTRSESRRLAISIRLLGAYQDGWIHLAYSEVENYSLQLTYNDKLLGIGHGDWLIDEVRLSNNGNGQVVHEIIFSSGAHWSIECRNIQYQWTEKPRSPS